MEEDLKKKSDSQPSSVPFKREPVLDVKLTQPYYENFTNLTIEDFDFIPDKALGVTMNLLERPAIEGKGNIEGLFRGRVKRLMGGCSFFDSEQDFRTRFYSIFVGMQNRTILQVIKD